MKANDNIPADEMLLAEMIAAASALGLVGGKGANFRRLVDDGTARCDRLWFPGATACCAAGALELLHEHTYSGDVVKGNDGGEYSFFDDSISGSAWNLGAAFNQAMTP